MKGIKFMKHRLKKINRGIVLAVILIIALVFYIINDYSNFKSEKGIIKQTITDFAEELYEFNVTPEKYQKLGYKFTDEEKIEYTDRFYELVDKYWCYNDKNTNYYYCTKSDYRNNIDSLLYHNDRGYITETETSLSNFTISKDGPNAAIVACTLKVVSVGTQDAATIEPTGFSFYNDGYNNENKKIDDTLYKTVADYQCSFQLIRKDGKWKIYTSECWKESSDSKMLSSIEGEDKGGVQ